MFFSNLNKIKNPETLKKKFFLIMIKKFLFIVFFLKSSLQKQNDINNFKEVEYISIYFKNIYDSLQKNKTSYINLIYKKNFFVDSKLNLVIIFECFLNENEKLFIGMKILENQNQQKIIQEFLSTNNLKNLENFFDVKIEKKTNEFLNNFKDNFLDSPFFPKMYKKKDNSNLLDNMLIIKKNKIKDNLNSEKNNNLKGKYLDESLIENYLQKKKKKRNFEKENFVKNKNIFEKENFVKNKNIYDENKSSYINDYINTINYITLQKNEIEKNKIKFFGKKNNFKLENNKIEFPRLKIKSEIFKIKKKKEEKKNKNIFINDITFLPSLNEVNYNAFSIHDAVKEKLNNIFQ